MERLRMPSSCAMIPDEELAEIIGGGELQDAWNTFTDHLHFDDIFYQGGLISISISFVPMLLFKVVRAGYDFAENVYNNLSSWFGFHDDTFSAVQDYTDEMRLKRKQRGV